VSGQLRVWGNNPRNQMDRRLGGPQKRVGGPDP